MRMLSIALAAGAVLAPAPVIAQAFTWGHAADHSRHTPVQCQVAMANTSRGEPWSQAPCTLVVFTSSDGYMNAHFHMPLRGRAGMVSFVMPRMGGTTSRRPVVAVGLSGPVVDGPAAYYVEPARDIRVNSCEPRGRGLVCSAMFWENGNRFGVVAVASLRVETLAVAVRRDRL